MMIPQALKDLAGSKKAWVVFTGALAYLAPYLLQFWLQASHMTQVQWDTFLSEAKQAWQHAAAAWAIVLPGLMALETAARNWGVTTTPPTEVKAAIAAVTARPEGD